MNFHSESVKETENIDCVSVWEPFWSICIIRQLQINLDRHSVSHHPWPSTAIYVKSKWLWWPMRYTTNYQKEALRYSINCVFIVLISSVSLVEQPNITQGEKQKKYHIDLHCGEGCSYQTLLGPVSVSKMSDAEKTYNIPYTGEPRKIRTELPGRIRSSSAAFSLSIFVPFRITGSTNASGRHKRKSSFDQSRRVLRSLRWIT